MTKNKILLSFIALFSLQSIKAQLYTEIIDAKFINLLATRDSNLIETIELGEPSLAFYLHVQITNTAAFPMQLNGNTFYMVINNVDSIQLYVCSGENILFNKEYFCLRIAPDSTLFLELYTAVSSFKLQMGQCILEDNELKDYPNTIRFLNKKSVLIFEYLKKEDKIMASSKISNFQPIIERRVKNEFFDSRPCIKKNKWKFFDF